MLSRILRFAFLPNLMTDARHFRSFVKRATSDASIAIADPAEGSLDAEKSRQVELQGMQQMLCANREADLVLMPHAPLDHGHRCSSESNFSHVVVKVIAREGKL